MEKRGAIKLMKSKKTKIMHSWLAFAVTLAMLISTGTSQVIAHDVDYTKPVSELPSLKLGGPPAVTAGSTLDNLGTGQDWISMTEARNFEAKIPVSMSFSDAQAAVNSGTFKWTLSRTGPYLSTDLYPNYKKGGDLVVSDLGNTIWKTTDKNPLPWFINVKTNAVQVGEKVYLDLTFSTNKFYYDGSVPHGSATNTMDYIGWYSLAAVNNGAVLGSAAAKIYPYDDFHTMGEIYDSIDALAATKTPYYVKRYSMGVTEAGYDMPYLIVAKDEKAVNNWLKLCDQAENDPAKVLDDIKKGKLNDIQVPVMFSNIHSNEAPAADSILKFSQMLLTQKTIDYNILTSFTDAGQTELNSEMTNTKLAIPDLVKNSATYLGFLSDVSGSKYAPNRTSGLVDLNKYYNQKTNDVNVSDLLNNVFFVLVPEENVEGRIYMSRVSSGGLDLNRDNSFQTQNETQNMQRLIGKYNPVSLTELHGRITAFQVEPCSPPHEPNFEYDLLAQHLVKGGEAFGIAAVANNTDYNSYVMPERDYLQYTGNKTTNGSPETYWTSPWDDMSTSYTPQFAMLHGTVSYTVECPAYNDQVTKGLAYGQLGQSVYVANDKLNYLKAQVEYFQRGVTNYNSDSYNQVGQWFSNQYDIEGADAKLFRPEYTGPGENGNFYPECYIIPLDAAHQTNLQAANDMMKWLTRNYVKVQLTKKAFTFKGVTYPIGTMIVSMYQATRSVANGALYDGTFINNWSALYSEGITTFNETRGFDMITCAEPAAYQTIAKVSGNMLSYEDCLKYLATVTSAFSGPTGAQVIISNASEDSTFAVNALLKAGKTVGMITDGPYKDDFICSYADWKTVCNNYILTGTGISENYPPASIIKKAPTIYITGKPAQSTIGYVNYALINNYSFNYDRQAMDLLNFNTTTDATKADVVIGANTLDTAGFSAVERDVPYIGYGSSGGGTTDLSKLFNNITRSAVGSGSMDALPYVTYPLNNLITASYINDNDDVMYGFGAGYYASVPNGADILVRVDASRTPTEGFLRASDAVNFSNFLNGSIQGFSYNGLDKNGKQITVALFANTLTNKVHQRDEYAFISNFIFSNLLSGAYDPSSVMTK
jgi:hypothetical protein